MDSPKSNAAPRQTRSTHFDTVEDALSFASTVASRIEAMADAMLGCEPCAATSQGGIEAPSGVLPRMAASAQYTRGRLDDAMAALDRIEKALP